MSCTTLTHYSGTPFTVLVLPFLYPMLETPLWWHGTSVVGKPGTPDLVGLLKSKYPQFKYSKMYKRNNACVVIVDGTESPTIPWTQFWSRSANGTKHLLSANPRAFYFWGALTYDEAMEQATKRMNVKSFHNRGEEGWTQLQRDTYNKTVMHFTECKKGEQRADFRTVNISQQIKDDAKNIYKWAYVFQ